MSNSSFDFQNRKILITGGASGIGLATAKLLSDGGAHIVVLDYNKEACDAAKDMLGKSTIIVADLLSENEYSSIFDAAIQDGIKLDGLVHCAGMAQVLPLNMLTFEKLHREMSLNYYTYIELVRQYAKRKYSDGGSIVGISSIAADSVEKCQTNYAASKAAMITASRALAIELAPKGIRINTVLPGVTNTPMAEEANGRDIEAIVASQLFGMVEPSDVANACAFLLSDLSRMITGRSIYVDGGRY
jgi:NAD(P)-dependent dehydrogenase (short-subunit alcohol dehydrogenase family)